MGNDNKYIRGNVTKGSNGGQIYGGNKYIWNKTTNGEYLRRSRDGKDAYAKVTGKIDPAVIDAFNPKVLPKDLVGPDGLPKFEDGSKPNVLPQSLNSTPAPLKNSDFMTNEELRKKTGVDLGPGKLPIPPAGAGAGAGSGNDKDDRESYVIADPTVHQSASGRFAGALKHASLLKNMSLAHERPEVEQLVRSKYTPIRYQFKSQAARNAMIASANAARLATANVNSGAAAGVNANITSAMNTAQAGLNEQENKAQYAVDVTNAAGQQASDDKNSSGQMVVNDINAQNRAASKSAQSAAYAQLGDVAAQHQQDESKGAVDKMHIKLLKTKGIMYDEKTGKYIYSKEAEDALNAKAGKV